MSFEMRFHHRDSLKKTPHMPSTAQGEKKGASLVYLPLKDIEFHTKDELVKAQKPSKADCPMPPSNSPFGRANSYLSPSECESLKINRHATSEKDQKLINRAERRAKILANIFGLGLPLLFSCIVGNKKDKQEHTPSTRPVHRQAHQ